MAVSTPGAIRDRVIALVTALTPTDLAGDRFRVSRDTDDAAFRASCLAAPQACLRRFQVRQQGKRGTPVVSNVDVARHPLALTIIVAYPNTHRYGAAAGRDRDDVIDEDIRRLDYVCGIYGRANFSTTHDCTPLGLDDDPEVETDGAVSFLVVVARYEYVMTVTP